MSRRVVARVFELNTTYRPACREREIKNRQADIDRQARTRACVRVARVYYIIILYVRFSVAPVNKIDRLLYSSIHV